MRIKLNDLNLMVLKDTYYRISRLVEDLQYGVEQHVDREDQTEDQLLAIVVEAEALAARARSIMRNAARQQKEMENNRKIWSRR
jgi:hypothetical protein